MSAKPYNILYSTMTFSSRSGRLYKYEIFKKSDAVCLTAMISKLERFSSGMHSWCLISAETGLLTQHHRPEYLENEVVQHFTENYLND